MSMTISMWIELFKFIGLCTIMIGVPMLLIIFAFPKKDCGTCGNYKEAWKQ